MVICAIVLILIGVIKFLFINSYKDLDLNKALYFQIKDNPFNFIYIIRTIIIIDSIICLISGILILL